MRLSQRRMLMRLASYGLDYVDLLVKFEHAAVSGWTVNDSAEFESSGETITERDYKAATDFRQSRFDYV